MNKQVFQKLSKELGEGRVTENKDLKSYFTIKAPATAKYFFMAEVREDLVKAKKTTNDYRLKLFILGGCSNIVPVSSFFDGLVVLNRYLDKKIIKEENDTVILSVSSGYPVGRLVMETVDQGLSGFEYQIGLPGTVGGAIYMNSKWMHPPNYFGDNLEKAYLLDDRACVKEVDRNYFHFAYDYSILHQTKEIVLEAVFKLKKTDPEELKKIAEQVHEYRKKTQPFGIFSTGCFFRNISEEERLKLNLPTTSAGYLIDKSGMKGYHLGGFFVSDKHANFVVNDGNGRTEDLKKILHEIKNRVKEKFGVELKEEVILI